MALVDGQDRTYSVGESFVKYEVSKSGVALSHAEQVVRAFVGGIQLQDSLVIVVERQLAVGKCLHPAS